MSNHSIIEHRASYYFIRIEEDFLAICCNGKSSPHCKALILAILEHWINTKRAKGEGNYVYLTIPQWIRHTYMLYERNVITGCLQELLEEGLIDRRQIIIHDQKTFEYTLNVDAIHEHLKKLPSKLDKETLPNLNPYLEHKARAKKAREDEKAKQEGVGEKSTTVVEKSPTAIEKSTGVGEKSTQQRVRIQITNLNSNIDSEERKNDAGQQKSHVSDQEESFSHSLIPQSSFEKSSFSSETKAEEEVTLSPEEQVVYELGSQTIFKVKRPKITPTVKGHCAEIAKAGVTTLDEMESLIAFVTKEDKRLIGKTLYLGNLVNALNGWLMAEKATKSVETLDMEAERERVRIKNAQQLELLRSRQRERAAQQNSAAQQ